MDTQLEKQKRENRILRAKRWAQLWRTVNREGFIYLQGYKEPLTIGQFKAHTLKACIFGMNSRDYNARCENATRAADILKNGENSRWYFARNSINLAGTNARGIVHYLNKFKKQLAKSKGNDHI